MIAANIRSSFFRVWRKTRLSIRATKLSGLAILGLTFVMQVHAQTPNVPETYHMILGKAGIARSQFMNGFSTKGSKESEYWYEKAAEAGNQAAIGNLAVLLYCGDHRPLDTQRAFKLLGKLNELGSAPAPWLIGISYFLGENVQQDYAKSFPWLELSARRGNPYAVKLVTQMYEEGLGVSKSDAMVTWWLQVAADHGDVDAQLRLARRLLNEPRKEKNFIAIYYWLLAARKDGASVSEEDLKEIEAKIDPKDIEILKMGNEGSGKYRWQTWDSDSMAGAYIFPCMRHLDNPLLVKLQSERLASFR